MKKLLNILTLLLALNFLLVAAGALWLKQAGHVDHEKLAAIKAILFPPPPVAAAAAEPATQPATRPISRLEELLRRQAGKPAQEQVTDMRRAFDSQMAILEHRRRELADLERQVNLASDALARDRAALERQARELSAQKEEENRLAADKGFQDSLVRYQAMQPKQVKEIFMGLSDQTVMDFLAAMQPRQAARIIKEFKSPAEMARIRKVLEMMRLSADSPLMQSAPARE